MFKPLSLFIGLKYTRAKKRNGFISFISAVSMLGIALGVAVLIVVMSVMNGFDYQIKHRILTIVPQVTITSWGEGIKPWQSLETVAKRDPHVTGSSPFIQGQGLLTYHGYSAFSVLQGINPSTQGHISPIGQKFTLGHLSNLQPGKFGIVLGQTIASNLGVGLGDKVTVVVPKPSLSPVGLLPTLKQFTVVGVFKVGYQYDSSYALINIQDAQKLFNMPNEVTGVQLKLDNLFNADIVTNALNRHLPPAYRASSWIEQNPNFFKALKMEKTIMFLMLALIIAVAVFNMLSSLVMLVTDKQSDIAILRTLGMRSGCIMRIFMVQGLSIGLIGTLIGVVLGVVLGLNVTAITNWYQHVTHTQILNSSVYYIDFIPSKLAISDVWHIALISIILSLCATLYPAWRASRIHPAEALRYE